MASRYYKDPTYDGFDETQGGEASPRPLKSRRLVDVMESSAKGKGTGRSATSASPRREITAPASTATQSPVLKQAETKKVTPQTSVPKQPIHEHSIPKHPVSQISAPKQPTLELPPDTYSVLSVTPAGEGETVTVVLAMPTPAGEKAQRVSFHLLVEQYAELGVKAGPIPPEEAETLLDTGRLCGAIRRGMAMLGYGDQSARRLAYKLTAKGVDRDTAARAVAYLTERGYIREDSAATLRAEQGLRKGWGERRIREDLCAHGFTREAVEEAMEALAGTDWEENCAAAIRRKYREIPADKGERQKLIVSVMRLGYDSDTVKAAMRQILREN